MKTFDDWARRQGLNESTVRKRVTRGSSILAALGLELRDVQ